MRVEKQFIGKYNLENELAANRERNELMEIQFQSRWFERCIREYLGIADRMLTAEDVSVIRYLYVSTTNGCLLGFGRGGLPEKFEFSDAGDEWFCRCLSDTAKYHNIEEFIDIMDWGNLKELSIRKELLAAENTDSQEENLSFLEQKKKQLAWKREREKIAQGMLDFEDSVRLYEAEERDFEGLVKDEKTYDYGILVPDDFSYLTNLEVVRLMSCETEIHSLAFLKAMPRLRVLEIGEVGLNTLEGLEKLAGLEKLCIWAN